MYLPFWHVACFSSHHGTIPRPTTRPHHHVILYLPGQVTWFTAIMNTEKNGYEQQNAFLYTSIANNAMVNGRLLYHMKCLLYTNDEILRKAGLYNASYNTFLITRGHHIPAIKTGWNVILAAILIVIVAISRPFSAGRTCVKIVHYRIMVHTGHITLCVNLYENAIKSAVWQSFFYIPWRLLLISCIISIA